MKVFNTADKTVKVSRN